MSDAPVAALRDAPTETFRSSELTPFLLGAGRQIRRLIDAGVATDPILIDAAQRVIGLLDYAAARLEAFPEIAAGVTPEQQALLQDTLTRMRAAGLDLPPGAGGDDFGHLQSIQAECLRRIAASPQASGFNDIFVRATALETKVREAFLERLQAGVAGAENAAAAADEIARAAPTPQEMTGYLRSRLASPDAIRVTAVEQLRGPNSKDILFLDVEGAVGWPRAVVMRRLRGFSANDKASMPFEFDLLGKLLAAGIPVPRPLLLEASPEPMGQPFLIMERLPGRATPVSALGSAPRDVITQMARHLARVHQLDLSLGRRDGPFTSARERLLPFLEEYHQKWRKYQLGPNPTLEHAFAWLRENVSRIDDTLAVVHGDYDLRNLLVEDGRIVALLDWERSHAGHPAEDVAYCINDVKAVMPFEDFVAIYQQAGGAKLAPEALSYFEIWTAMTRAVGATQVRDAFIRGVHTDYITASFGVIEFQQYMERLARPLSLESAK